MYGRGCRYLLAVSVLIVAPGLVRAQSSRVDSAPDLAVSLRTDLAQPPARDQLRPHVPISPPGTPPRTIGFPLIARAAGTIFSGTVTAIARRPASPSQAVETVAITFHIENAIRGATRGEDLTISQWIGLWSSGQRYRIGERVLLFLYPPSKLGLTSCVVGAMGRFMIDPRGRVLLSAQHLSAFRADPVLGGKSRVSFSDFALAVHRAGEEE
jgi:hypothetical protein